MPAHPERPSREVGRRLGLVLIALLAVVLLVVIGRFLTRPDTVLIADLTASQHLDTDIAKAGATAQDQGADRILFVISAAGADTTQCAGGCVTQEMVLGLIQDLQDNPPASVLISPDKDSVEALLPPSSRLLNMEGEEKRAGSSRISLGPGTLAAWSLLLLFAGAILTLATRKTPVGSGAPAPPVVRQPPDHRAPATTPEAVPTHAAPAPDRPDLKRFGGRSTVLDPAPQCPCCGAFHPRPAGENGSGGHGYRCEYCDHSWTVASGEPWPTVVVRPRRRSVP